MTEYKELVNRLKVYSLARKGEISELTKEAADAIETLLAALNEQQRALTGRTARGGAYDDR